MVRNTLSALLVAAAGLVAWPVAAARLQIGDTVFCWLKALALHPSFCIVLQ